MFYCGFLLGNLHWVKVVALGMVEDTLSGLRLHWGD